MNAKEFRSRVQVQTRTPSVEFGGSPTWSTTAIRWAKVEMLGGTEVVQVSQLKAKTNFKITMRYLPITTANRLVYDSRNLNIESVVHDNRKNEMAILATEVPPFPYLATRN